jgi:hypothetical protein
MRHRFQTALSACAALLIVICAGCQLKRINARTLTLSSTLTIGIGDLAPGCRFSDSDRNGADLMSAIPVRSSIHFTADVTDDKKEAQAAARTIDKSTCERDRRVGRSITID